VNVQSLDGGFGQDILVGAAGVDRFLFGNGGAALAATSSAKVNELLTDVSFWADMSDAEKDLLWREGVVLAAQPKLIQDQIRASADAEGMLTAAGTGAEISVDTISSFESGAWRDVMELTGSLAGMTQELWQCEGTLFSVDSEGDLDVIETSAPHPNRIGIVAGALEDIQKLGIGSPQLAYATDTRQLMFDADGNWSEGSISLGTVNVNGPLTKTNFRFGTDSGPSLGIPATAPITTD
jgi:Ca2+-binding RTX toxin-like protein